MSAFLPVLAYQKIGHAPKNSHLKNEWTSPRQLAQILTWLLKHNYTFITPPDLSKELPPKPILLAFFGGYESFYKEVFPLLQAHGICATLLVAVETLGTYNAWQNPHEEPWQNTLSAKQLSEMLKSKLVQIGTLGLDGHNLLADEPSQAQQFVRESIYRLKKLYKIDVCALGFWPNRAWNSSRAQHISHGLNLPVFTSQTGYNPRVEKHFLRVLRPGFFTKLRLWKNK